MLNYYYRYTSAKLTVDKPPQIMKLRKQTSAATRSVASRKQRRGKASKPEVLTVDDDSSMREMIAIPFEALCSGALRSGRRKLRKR